MELNLQQLSIFKKVQFYGPGVTYIYGSVTVKLRSFLAKSYLTCRGEFTYTSRYAIVCNVTQSYLIYSGALRTGVSSHKPSVM